jgi:hypothetical protein
MITDSLGVGALPDAAKYGDQGADTFGNIVREMEAAGTPINMPNLLALGWGNIDGVCGGKLAVSEPTGCYGKMDEISAGKDTTTGHWEIAGLKTEVPFKTYPDGFPADFMAAFEEAIRAAINKGAKIVIVDNSAIAKAVYNMQEVYPEIKFIMLDAYPYDPDNGDILITQNTVAADFDSAQAGYLAGYAAVIDGSTELGFIGQSGAEDIKAFGCGYVMGAERAAGEIGAPVTMDYKYCEDASDRDAVYQQAAAMYDNGAQVIFAAGTNIQDPVIEAAEAKDGKVIGSETDQSAK